MYDLKSVTDKLKKIQLGREDYLKYKSDSRAEKKHKSKSESNEEKET